MNRFSVLGGGIIGMSIAWRMAQSGMQVTVFDAGRIGGSERGVASWAGAGMLAPGGEVEGSSKWAELAVESLRIYPDFVGELQEESGAQIDFRQCGAIERDPIPGRAEAQRKLGIRSERISDRDIFYPDDAIVNPRDVVQALRVACQHRGVNFRENEAVHSVQGPVVIAAGAWASSIETPVPIPPSFPIKGHLVSYRMPPGSLGSILRSGHTYILQRWNGVTIAGSSTERIGFDHVLNQEIVAEIDRRARNLFPQLPEPESAWFGFRPATESLQPEIRRLPGTDIFLAYGHYRNGILLAPITANLQMDLLSNNADPR